MAKEQPKTEVKKPRRRKQQVTVREKAQKESAKKASPKKTAAIKTKVARPIKKVAQFGKREYQPIKAPDKKGFRVLNKRVRFVPKFISSSWAEVKQVTWPTKREAASKTVAVIIFALIFAAFVQLLDYVFSRIVKEIILR